MAEVEISNLTKTYPSTRRPATDDVSLSVADGEFLVLVGPSGCGKTTLLRMVAGLETPDGGTVRIGPRDVTGLPPRQRDVSMVFQSYAIFPHLRVRENIGFGLTMRRTAKPEWQSRVRDAARMLDLTDYLDRYPAQLSGGQRQRVAVARAIAVDAQVLLMDEPLSNLDALLRLQFRGELKKLVARLGVTTLYVTHDQAEAMSLGDRVAVLRDGRIVQAGPPMQVYDRPDEQFVGGFLGSPPMNFFTTEASRDADGVWLAAGEERLGAPRELARWSDRKLTVGVRAENIEVALEPAGVSGWYPAEVDLAEPTGATVLLTVRYGPHELKVQAGPGFAATWGTRVWLRVPPGALRFFDPETGLALPLE
jgi:multiple sugar transport system ATP-binding protein